jgi:hypothetical protein
MDSPKKRNFKLQIIGNLTFEPSKFYSGDFTLLN